MSDASGGERSSALLLGLAASLGAALPATWRVAQSGGPATAVVALWASVSLVVVPLCLWLRQAGEDERRGSVRAIAAGAALSALPLALFGGVLKSTTHHRPLGGATFAVVALGVLALCLGLSLRILRKGGSGAVKSAWQNLFSLGCGLSLLGTLLLGAAAGSRPSLVDFLALAGGVAVAGLLQIPGWLRAARPGVSFVGWAALIACGVLVTRNPQLARSLPTQAPVSFAALSWLGVGS